MSKFPQTIKIESPTFTGQATKEAQDEPWLINHPGGDERFYGSVPEALRLIKTLCKINEEPDVVLTPS